MKIFLSNIEENQMYQKILTVMSRGDILYLLHPDNKDNVPLALVNFFQQTKGTVQFISYDHNNADLNKAYLYGQLIFQYDVINLVSNDNILKTASMFSNESIKPADIQETLEEIKIEEKQPVMETKQPIKKVVVVKKEAAPAQETTQPAETTQEHTTDTTPTVEPVQTEDLIQPSKELTDLCTKLSSSEMVLVDYIPQIIKSVEMAINESESFSSSLMNYCKNDIAEKIEDAFCGYETELFAIIENMKEKG